MVSKNFSIAYTAHTNNINVTSWALAATKDFTKYIDPIVKTNETIPFFDFLCERPYIGEYFLLVLEDRDLDLRLFKGIFKLQKKLTKKEEKKAAADRKVERVNQDIAERIAMSIYDFFDDVNIQIEGKNIYIQHLYSEPNNLGTDENGVYEYTLELNCLEER